MSDDAAMRTARALERLADAAMARNDIERSKQLDAMPLLDGGFKRGWNTWTNGNLTVVTHDPNGVMRGGKP